MAANETSAAPPAEHVDYEAVLLGVIALANLFSNCVEAFGLIHPAQRWEKEEQLLLCRLGLQQARLLIWGDVVGVTSPPLSVTDRVVPKHPSAAYPDLTEPTFFGPRDARLEASDTRPHIDDGLSAIVDRSAAASREEMMHKFGLKPPKKAFGTEFQAALDTNRLEAFRERYGLLKQVAESYAQINTRRTHSIVQSTWQIADSTKFDSFIKLTQEKVDYLINMMDVKERVDRAMCMDIKALGWHLAADRTRIAADVSKLQLIQQSCANEYPEYLAATKQALDNIEREKRENVFGYNPYASVQMAPVNTPHQSPQSGRGSISAQGGTNGASAAKHKHGVFGGLFNKFGGKKHGDANPGRSLSVANASPAGADDDNPPRALSDAGPMRLTPDSADTSAEPIRSKSVGHILDGPVNNEDEEMIRHRLEKMSTNVTSENTLTNMNAPNPTVTTTDTDAAGYQPHEEEFTGVPGIDRHDQYHGLGRQGTKNQ